MTEARLPGQTVSLWSGDHTWGIRVGFGQGSEAAVAVAATAAAPVLQNSQTDPLAIAQLQSPLKPSTESPLSGQVTAHFKFFTLSSLPFLKL